MVFSSVYDRSFGHCAKRRTWRSQGQLVHKCFEEIKKGAKHWQRKYHLSCRNMPYNPAHRPHSPNNSKRRTPLFFEPVLTQRSHGFLLRRPLLPKAGDKAPWCDDGHIPFLTLPLALLADPCLVWMDRHKWLFRYSMGYMYTNLSLDVAARVSTQYSPLPLARYRP